MPDRNEKIAELEQLLTETTDLIEFKRALAVSVSVNDKYYSRGDGEVYVKKLIHQDQDFLTHWKRVFEQQGANGLRNKRNGGITSYLATFIIGMLLSSGATYYLVLNTTLQVSSQISSQTTQQYVVINNCPPGWIQSPPIKGVDGEGREVEFRVNIMSQEFKWEFNSAENIQFNGVTTDIRQHFSRLDVTSSKAIICVGTASVEGNREEQENLADSRADKLLTILREQGVMDIKNKGLYKLNLGQYKIQDSNLNKQDTATQRRVILVEVIESQKNANVADALKNALINNQSKTPLSVNVQEYSTFKVENVKEIQ